MKIDFQQIPIVTSQLKLLANPDRLKILCVLAEQDLHVQHIEQLTMVNQPTLSQQLTVLRNADIVATRRDGKQIFYRIKDKKILQLMQSLYQLYCGDQ